MITQALTSRMRQSEGKLDLFLSKKMLENKVNSLAKDTHDYYRKSFSDRYFDSFMMRNWNFLGDFFIKLYIPGFNTVLLHVVGKDVATFFLSTN